VNLLKKTLPGVFSSKTQDEVVDRALKEINA